MTTEHGHPKGRAAAVTVLVMIVAAAVLENPGRVGAGHGNFARGDVLVAHDGGVQWWSGGAKEKNLPSPPGQANFGLAFDETGALYAAYRQEEWATRHYRPLEACVPTPGSNDPRRANPPTYPNNTLPPPVSTPCQSDWTRTSWVTRFDTSGPQKNLGGQPKTDCRVGAKLQGDGRPETNRCDDYLPQAIAFGRDNAAFIGAALGGIIKVSGSTRRDKEFDLPRHIVGASFLALSPDKCTAYYTSLDPAVHRFNVCDPEGPLPDLVPALPASAAPGGQLYGLAVRPNGDVLVGSTDGVHRITSAGVVVGQPYRVPGAKRFFAVAVDPSDDFFWAAASDGKVHRIRFDNGTTAGAPLDTGVYVLGLAVKGGPPPPAGTPPDTTSDTTSDTTPDTTPSQPRVDVFASAARVEETNSGTAEALFSVTLSGPAPGPVRVDYSTADGTASAADGDYVATSGTLEFDAQTQVTKQIAVQVNGDTTDEPDETFLFNLTAASGATIRSGQATAAILNDDAPVTTPNDPATGPGGGGSSQQNQQTRPENTPPSGTTGGGGTSPTPVSGNAPTPVQPPAPVPGASPVGGAAPTPVAVSSPVPMAGAVAGPVPAGVPGAPMTAQLPAPAGGELRPGRSGGGRNHEMVRHSSNGGDETGTAGATAGATLLFGCFMVGVVRASRRRGLFRGSPAWNEATTRRPDDPPPLEQRERW